MIVKVCGITNLGDALVAAEAGATALGFNFYPQSPRYVTPEHAARLIEGLPPAVWKVGVFVNEAAEVVSETARQARLDVVQIHGDSGAPAGRRIWRALQVGPSFRPDELDEHRAEAFLLDAFATDSYGGTGRTWDWALAAGARHKIILAGGLDAGNVREAIRRAHPWGVDACSRLESSPGQKDHEKMRAFIEAVWAVTL